MVQSSYQQEIIRWILRTSEVTSTRVWFDGRREDLYAKCFVWRWPNGRLTPLGL